MEKVTKKRCCYFTLGLMDYRCLDAYFLGFSKQRQKLTYYTSAVTENEIIFWLDDAGTVKQYGVDFRRKL